MPIFGPVLLVWKGMPSVVHAVPSGPTLLRQALSLIVSLRLPWY